VWYSCKRQPSWSSPPTTFVSNAQERVPTASLRRLRSVGFRILYATHTGCAPPPDERKPLATGVHRHSPRAPLGWRRTRVHPLLGPTPGPRTAEPPSRSDRGGAHRSTGGQSPRPKRSAPFPPWAFPAGSAARGCFLMRSPRDADAQSSVRLPTAGGACAGRPARGGGPPSPLPPHRHCDRSPRGAATLSNTRPPPSAAAVTNPAAPRWCSRLCLPRGGAAPGRPPPPPRTRGRRRQPHETGDHAHRRAPRRGTPRSERGPPPRVPPQTPAFTVGADRGRPRGCRQHQDGEGVGSPSARDVVAAASPPLPPHALYPPTAVDAVAAAAGGSRTRPTWRP